MRRDQIIILKDKSDKDEWNYFYRRILQKDMRCGLSERTVNNVAKKNNYQHIIPVFSCQLAQDCELHKKLNGKKSLEVKLDGEELRIWHIRLEKIDMFSRNGKELNNFNHIKDEINKKFDTSTINEALILDGEVISDDFQTLMKQIHRKNSAQNKDAQLFLFDMLPLENFKKGIFERPYFLRIDELKRIYKEYFDQSRIINIIDSVDVDLDTEEGVTEFKNFNKSSILNGYEGIMIKDPESFTNVKDRQHG